MSGGIFISYRREDSAGFARAIYDRLVKKLEREHVFFDVDAIELGVDFVNVLSDRVGDCDVLVAIIGRNWLSIRDENDRKRLDDPLDYVRIEIEAALARDIKVIPVLVDGARMPRSENLPDGLKALARRNGMEISHTRFDFDVEQLAKALSLIDEERRKRDAAQAERIAREEREKQEAAEAARQAEEERRKRDRAEAESIARKRKVATEAARQAEEEFRKRDAAERIAREERGKLEATEATRKAEQERSGREAAEVARRTEEAPSQAAAERHGVVEADVEQTACEGRAVAEGARTPQQASPGASLGRTLRLANGRVLVSISAVVVAVILAVLWAAVRPGHYVVDYIEAIAGDARAQNNIGDLYYHGWGVTTDYAQAMAWYGKAADQGYADAQISIGWQYEHGLGVKQDYAQARAWYQKAADQGNEYAKSALKRLPAN